MRVPRLLFKTILVPAAIISALVCDVFAIPWPLQRELVMHSIGNTYGEYQNYGGTSYLHPGLDILVEARTPVYAVKAGYVKAVLTTSASLHWRVAVGDSPGTAECDGWLYAHLEESSIHVLPGEYVEEGDYLGRIVEWTVASFHHIHFVKIRNSGYPWNADWEFIANPLDELVGTLDIYPPLVLNCYPEQKFAFLEDGTHNYFAPGSVLSGDVDIIAQVGDHINNTTWLNSPYTLAYEMYNDTMTTGLKHSVTFTGPLYYTENVGVIFQDDAQFDTRGDYNARIYYHIITNTDGDSLIEATDVSGCWHTTDFDNGSYWVKVFVADRDGFDGTNYDAVDSMQVEIYNEPPCSCPDFCDVNRDGDINPVDVVYMVNYVYRSLDARVQIANCPGDNGDWNCDEAVNPVDVVYYVNYVYKTTGSGPCEPCAP